MVQHVKNGGWTSNNFNKMKFSMENHTVLIYLGIKFIKIGTDDTHSMNFSW